ncbi:MAG: hypothetical protein DRG66_05490 [Deltaproteobacteria bacterium]|nr:MAG: hypothetical protein DRG66_05490 [Deltaproteobacteria bacterium]
MGEYIGWRRVLTKDRRTIAMIKIFRNRSRVLGSEVLGSPQTRLPSLPAVRQVGVGQSLQRRAGLNC